MSITLSDSAAARVNAFPANRGKGFGLRLGVRTSGCSGMAYVLEFVDEPAAEDTVFEDKGVKVVIDGKVCNSSTALSWTSSKKASTKGSNSLTLTSKMSAAAAKALTYNRYFSTPPRSRRAWGFNLDA